MSDERERCPITYQPCDCPVMCSIQAQTMLLATDVFLHQSEFVDHFVFPVTRTKPRDD